MHDPDAAELGTDSSLSESPLQLVLVRTAPGQNARDGTATLGPNPRNPQTYAAGAVLENGAQLVEIYSDHVVLERGGLRARLYGEGRSPGDSTVGVVPPRPESSASSEDPQLQLTHVGGFSGHVVSPTRTEEPALQAIRVQPAYDAGEIVGFQVQPGVDRAALERLGLEGGDVIGFIDGRRVSHDSQWREIADALSDGRVVDVSVVRDGHLTHVALDGLRLTERR